LTFDKCTYSRSILQQLYPQWFSPMSIGKVTLGSPKIIINEAIKKIFFAAFWIQLPFTYPTAPKPTALFLIICSTILNLLENDWLCSLCLKVPNFYDMHYSLEKFYQCLCYLYVLWISINQLKATQACRLSGVVTFWLLITTKMVSTKFFIFIMHILQYS